MKSLVRSGIALTGAAVLGATLAVGGASVMSANPGNGGGGKPATSAEIYQDDVEDYGACRGLDPTCYNDWGNGFEEGEEKRILIWSRTAGPRHAHLGAPLGDGMNPELGDDNVAQRELVSWADERGIKADWTEDLDEFRRLGGYQAVVFLSANRDTLGDLQQNELTKYVRGGGGFVGIHNAFGAEYNWEWYEGLLGGANFYDHGPNRDGTVETIDRDDVSTEFLPSEFGFTDEFYNLYPYPSHVNILLEASEDTVTLDRDGGHPGHGDAHPLSWNHYYDGGRAWLTTLGHEVEAWTGDSENADLFEDHVMNGVESAMGVSPFLGD
ncbi:ThuA domain-containing protein [Microbacterium halophytorum]|uniref:ThuA domain-containing protein n=1 Tax=Microbacterium halophytorum TaxID=2067568 RepID=UPI001E292F6F|nr:ThuA domain-containing protein [Microbacterium halophytorum]